MKDLRLLLPTAADVLRLSPRELGGYILEAHNLDTANARNHPKNIRNSLVEWYPGTNAQKVTALVIQALDLLRRDGYIVQTYDDAVDNEWFVLTDKGREVSKHDDIYSPPDPAGSSKPLVFISCGQVGSDKIRVGQELAKLVEAHTGCEAYFAQNQHTLDALSNNILGALDRSVALVVIMHKRGTVTFPGGSHDRGSVWIEQEIAMAALLKHVFKRDIIVQAYIENGVEREGLRTLLQLNETPFTTNDEIIADFTKKLVEGTFRPGAPSPEPGAAPSTPSTSMPEPPEPAYVEEARAEISEAVGQGGLMLPTYICAFWLTMHPLRRAENIITEERERDIVSEAKLEAGGAFPIGGPNDGVALEDGYRLFTMTPGSATTPEIREWYTLKRNGLFVYGRISPDDFDDARQHVGSNRFVRFTTITQMIWQMAHFAAKLVALYDTDVRATIAVTNLGNHALLDDATLLGEERSRPSHIERVATEYSGSASDFAANADAWAVETVTKCLKALNVRMAPNLIPAFVDGYYKKHGGA